LKAATNRDALYPYHGRKGNMKVHIQRDSHYTHRSLLGDFDFGLLRKHDGVMGPMLFILFAMLAIFVMLNMVIAIICGELVGWMGEAASERVREEGRE
jgi:hypothetical protein